MDYPCDAVLIAGPTASGKSALALALAEETGGIVINADSMQVYRQIRLLSARPPDEDLARAPHLLYGHISAEERYSVGRYQIDASAALAEARAQNRLPIFVGGTGLYFAALTEGLADIPPVSADIREDARNLLQELGVAGLHAELSMRDPETALGLRPTDPQRVLRAWEVLEATGRPLSSWQREAGTPVLKDVNLARFVLDIDRFELRERIKTRFLQMLEAGAMDEALGLKSLDPTLPAAKILGLRELLALHSGELSMDEAMTLAVTATRQFAKRQTTWFRNRMADWTWLPVESNIMSHMRQIFS